ncbi:MAG: hypothetical protein STHCBS139747_003623 [Sporothrix thermara]
MTLTIYNKISILQIAFFIPSLVVAATLSYRHGFKRSAGWIYLLILSLMRIIGAGLQLGTMNAPDNIHLAIGAQTLQNIGLSPLILVLLGLTTRSYLAMPETDRPKIPNARILRLLQLVVAVGLALILSGGIKLGNQVGEDLAKGLPLSYNVSTESKVGIVLILAGFALLVLSAAVLLARISAVPSGEKRLLVSIFIAVPFVFVRLLYSILAVFDTANPNFRQFGGSTTAGYYVLGMCTVMEIVAVIIFELVGMTLPYVPHSERSSLMNSSRATQNIDGQPLSEYPPSASEDYPKLQHGDSA